MSGDAAVREAAEAIALGLERVVDAAINQTTGQHVGFHRGAARQDLADAIVNLTEQLRPGAE